MEYEENHASIWIQFIQCYMFLSILSLVKQFNKHKPQMDCFIS